MRIAGILAGVTLFVAGYIYLQQSQLPAPQKLSQDGNITVYELANGMKVIAQEDDRADVVVSQVWYKVGASYEPEGKTGMSHVLEHMMFKGTADYPAGKFSELIALNGGRENAFTSKDYTAYFQRIASDRLELCLKLEADRMRHLTLDENEFKKELEVVKEERRLRTEDKPTSLAYEKFNAEAFKGGAYSHPVIGWMQDLNNLTVQDLRDWYQKWYAPNNATLVVTGNVEAGQVAALANQYFGPLKPSKLSLPVDDLPEPQLAIRETRVSLPAKVPYLMMGFKVPSLTLAADEATVEDVYALEVLSGILDGGNSARMMKNLVRGSQVAASASASYNLYDRLGTLFMLSGLPAPGHTMDDLKQALFNQLGELRAEPPSQQELDRVKAQVIAATVYEKDSMFYQAMQLGTLETIGLGWQKKDEYLRRISAVTAEKVQQVAQKYFSDSALTITELVPLPMEMKQPAQAAPAGGRHEG